MEEKSTLVDFFSIECRKEIFFPEYSFEGFWSKSWPYFNVLRQFEIPSIAYISGKGPNASIIKLINGIKSHLGCKLLVVTNEVRGRAQTTWQMRGGERKMSIMMTYFMNDPLGYLNLHFKKLLRFTMILFRSCFYKVWNYFHACLINIQKSQFYNF